jgi:hypothetical protein
MADLHPNSFGSDGEKVSRLTLNYDLLFLPMMPADNTA